MLYTELPGNVWLERRVDERGVPVVITVAVRLAAELHVRGVDLDGLPGVPVLVLPLLGLELAHDGHLSTLAQVLAAQLGGLPPSRDAVPLRPLLAVTVLVGVVLVGSDAEVRHRDSRAGLPELRVRTEVAAQNHYVVQRLHVLLSIV